MLSRCGSLCGTVALTLGSLGSLVGCQAKVAAPPRPATVPASASWAGGADGGAWINCTPLDTGRFACVVFDDDRGTVWARGEYLLQGPASATSQTTRQYRSFNGVQIDLVGGQALVPDGWIEFPFPDGGGKRQRFAAGRPVSEQQQFPGSPGTS